MTGVNLSNVSMLFDGLQPGKCISIPGISLNDMGAIWDVAKHSNSAYKSWEVQIASVPQGLGGDEVAKTVTLYRVDGLSLEDREVVNVRISEKHRVVVAQREFTFSPLASGFKPRTDKIKQSRVGWEHMALGDSVIVHTIARDLRLFLGRAIGGRGLDWTFHVLRLSPDNDKVPTWRVTRIT